MRCPRGRSDEDTPTHALVFPRSRKVSHSRDGIVLYLWEYSCRETNRIVHFDFLDSIGSTGRAKSHYQLNAIKKNTQKDGSFLGKNMCSRQRTCQKKKILGKLYETKISPKRCFRNFLKFPTDLGIEHVRPWSMGKNLLATPAGPIQQMP